MNPALEATVIDACNHGVDAAQWERLVSGRPAAELQEVLSAAVRSWCADPLSAHRGAKDLACLLIKHGANPLSGTDPVLSMELCSAHPDIAVHIVNLLYRAQLDHGIDHRTDAGGNALHALVSYCPDWLGGMLDSAFKKSRFQVANVQTMSLPSYAHIHPDWLAQPQDDGATPLHLWWRKAQALYEFYDRDQLAAFKVWDTFIYLAEEGAPLDAVDRAGVSVAELMVEAIDAGVDASRGEPWLSQARAIHQDLSLQSTTAPAASPSKAPRL